MKDGMSSMLKFVDHYRYTILSIVLVCLVMGFSLGCESTTTSLRDPSKTVSAQGLQYEAMQITGELQSDRATIDAMIAEHNAQVEMFNAQVELAQADLEQKEAVKAELFAIGGSVLTSAIEGTVNPVSLVGTGLTALALLGGIGASVDNRRKDAKISQLKKVGVTSGTPPTV